jgi:hypothetical protein
VGETVDVIATDGGVNSESNKKIRNGWSNISCQNFIIWFEFSHRRRFNVSDVRSSRQCCWGRRTDG